MTPEQHEDIRMILDCIEQCHDGALVSQYHAAILRILQPHYAADWEVNL